jgi:EAL domain-containing protein (putative c-di-GMP-specific phosphodiesterase class I)
MHMGDYGRFAFEPMLSLVHGRSVGVEVRRCRDRDRTEVMVRRVVWGTRQLTEFDAGIAIASVLQRPDYDSTVPVHVDVCADSVVAARPRLSRLPDVLRGKLAPQPAPQVVLDVRPALSAAPPADLVEGVKELRAAGFGIALDDAGRGFGLDLIAELHPDLVKIDAELVAQLPTDERAQVVVAALCEVCRVVGVRVAATGVTSRDELSAVRDFGITWAQGPLLAAARRKPGMHGIVLPVELMPRIQAARDPAPRTARLPTVASLAKPPLVVADDVRAEVVREAFAAHPQATSVVLVDAGRRPTGTIDRTRFLIAVSGPYGHALYANRPATGLADAPRTIGATTDVPTALQYAIRDRSRAWDDLVVLDGSLVCSGVVAVADLLDAGSESAAHDVA